MTKPWVGPSFVSPGEEAGKGWSWATTSVQYDVPSST